MVMPKKMNQHKQNPYARRRAFSTAQPIGLEIHDIVKPFMEKQGFVEARIVLDWEKIVGPFLAEHTTPERISFLRGQKTDGTLYLKTTSAVSPEIQHLTPSILERVNTYFGYQAVTKIHLLHTKIRKRESLPKMQEKNKKNKAILSPYEELLESIPEENIRHSLERLAHVILDNE